MAKYRVETKKAKQSLKFYWIDFSIVIFLSILVFLILCLNVIPEQYFRQDVYTLSIFVFVLCMIYGIFFIVLEFVPGLKEKITKQKHASSDLEAEMDMIDIDDEINSEFDSDFDLETTSENNNEE